MTSEGDVLGFCMRKAFTEMPKISKICTLHLRAKVLKGQSAKPIKVLKSKKIMSVMVEEYVILVTATPKMKKASEARAKANAEVSIRSLIADTIVKLSDPGDKNRLAKK